MTMNPYDPFGGPDDADAAQSVNVPRAASATPPWSGAFAPPASAPAAGRRRSPLMGLFMGCACILLLALFVVLRPDQYLLGAGTIRPVDGNPPGDQSPAGLPIGALQATIVPSPTTEPSPTAEPPSPTPLPPSPTVEPSPTTAPPSPEPSPTQQLSPTAEAPSATADMPTPASTAVEEGGPPLPDTAEGDSLPWLAMGICLLSAVGGAFALKVWHQQRYRPASRRRGSR